MSTLASPVRRDLIRTGKYGNRAEGAGGTKASATHLGIDLRAAIGTPVYAPITGTVVQIRRRFPDLASEGSSIFSARMAGNLVVIRGWLGKVEVDVNLAHLDSVAAALAVGQKVVAGATWLGASGRSGVVEPHVHLGVFRLVRNASGRVVDWIPMDPTPLLPWDGDKFGEQLAGGTGATPAAPAPQEDAMDAKQYKEFSGKVDTALEALEWLMAAVGGTNEGPSVRGDLSWLKVAVGGSNETSASIRRMLSALSNIDVPAAEVDVAALAKELAELLPAADAERFVDELHERLRPAGTA